MSFTNYQEIEEAFVKKELYSGDLKTFLVTEVTALVSPLREAIQQNLTLFYEAYPQEKPQPKSAGKKGKNQPGENQQLTSMLNIVVGEVVDVQPHPSADSLYVEKIDLGEEEPRTIVSGLKNHIAVEDFVNKKVCVLANLKPSKLRGIVSQGMVLCASTDDKSKIELLHPPADADVGERLVFADDDGESLPQLPPRKKIFEKVAEDFKTDDELRAAYKGKLLTSSKGFVTSTSLANASIS